MEYINNDWIVVASFVLLAISVLLIHFLGSNPKMRKFVAVAMVAALALMFIGSRS